MEIKEENKVAPRYNPKNYETEKIDGVMDMGALLQKDKREAGMSFYGDAAELAYNTAPGFGISNGKRTNLGASIRGGPPKEQPRSLQEAMDEGEMYKPLDCTHGCYGQGTVEPLHAEQIEWQCKSCGKRYQMTKGE